MSGDSTNGQQPNPGEGGSANDAAKPNGPTGENAGGTGGQGTGGDAGGNAGEQGAKKPGEGEGGTGDGQAKPNDPPQDQHAPEAYSDFTLPEGFVLEGERKDEALALFRELDMSQERAQKAIDYFTKTVAGDAAVQQAGFEAASLKLREDWAKEAKAELGERYDAEVALAKTAVNALNSSKLTEAFEQHHWGNHPELIKAFAFFGKMMRDSPIDGIGNSGAAAVKPKPWDAMYANSDMK